MTETTTPSEPPGEGKPARTEEQRRQQAEGDLGLSLCEYVWNRNYALQLGGDEYEVADNEDVPGYEDDDSAVLLKRKGDGRLFEAFIDVTMREAGDGS